MKPSPAQLFAQITTTETPGDSTVIMHRAVVLGGSMAGLLAARVLSDHADEVLIIERDDAEVDGPRPGVPQGSQVHALLPAGQAQLERWFPGFTAEALASGAPPMPNREPAIYINDQLRTAPHAEADGQPLITTRPFLEALVRRRTLALKNVRLVAGRAEGLVLTGQRVTGVRYLPQAVTEPVTLDADLVLDAMGRSSRLNDWLAEGGWPRAPMRRMPIKLNYASALFAHDSEISDAWVAVSQTTPGSGRIARIGGINLVEGNRWIMLVAGYDDDRPSRDVADFTARCREHFPQMFGEIAERAAMIGEVITYHQADSRRRDFHQLSRMPAGLLAAGDAVASFNPIYGQGMTSAALHASCLSQYLRTAPNWREEPAKAYFSLVRVVVDAAWQISTFADLELPHVDQRRPRGYRLTKWFSEVILTTSLTDARIGQRLDRVTQMLEHPQSLASPDLLLRALRLRYLSRSSLSRSNR